MKKFKNKNQIIFQKHLDKALIVLPCFIFNLNLQYVANYSYGPHVRFQANWLVADNFWWDEFRCAE